MMKCPETQPNEINDDDDNDGVEKRDEEKGRHTWGTWEELLLACAVKRHGLKDWESVATEVQTRSALPPTLTTAINCKEKYRDLKRRFREQSTSDENEEDEEEDDENNGTDGGGEDKIDAIPWLEQLRSLRVEELKRELQRFDVSILSLQLKVKRLEEEGDQKADLGNERSKDEKKESKRSKPVIGEESDRDNRSVNESNSTGSEDKTEAQPEEVRGESVDPDPVPVPGGSVSRGSEVSDSGAFGGESGTRTSGDVESSARKRKRKKIDGGEIRDVGSAPDAAVKSQPLVGFLDLIRAHRHGSLFERRLQSQESDDYKNVVRQHLDLETIQTKLNQGSYTSSRLAFYRDLLLIFTNVIVFFPKSSAESVAANQLQNLVISEMRKESQNPDSNSQDPASPANNNMLAPKLEPERSDSLLAKQKSSAPLVVCRKRSSVSTKPSSHSSFTQKAEQEKKPEQPSKEEEKPVTGTRSSRRNNKVTSSIADSNTAKTTASNKKQAAAKPASSEDNKPETPKTENKKGSTSDKKKSMADFLKRIKKNSPVKTSPKKGGRRQKEQKINEIAAKNENKGKERVLRNTAEKKKAKEENSSPPRKSMGRQAKKGAEPAAATGKRGKEKVGGGKQNQPKKRARK